MRACTAAAWLAALLQLAAGDAPVAGSLFAPAPKFHGEVQLTPLPADTAVACAVACRRRHGCVTVVYDSAHASRCRMSSAGALPDPYWSPPPHGTRRILTLMRPPVSFVQGPNLKAYGVDPINLMTYEQAQAGCVALEATLVRPTTDTELAIIKLVSQLLLMHSAVPTIFTDYMRPCCDQGSTVTSSSSTFVIPLAWWQAVPHANSSGCLTITPPNSLEIQPCSSQFHAACEIYLPDYFLLT